MKQRRRDHYTGIKYDLLQATHRYIIRAQGTTVDPTAQHVAVQVTNVQGHHQANVVI